MWVIRIFHVLACLVMSQSLLHKRLRQKVCLYKGKRFKLISCLHRGICDDLIFINVIHFIMSLSLECQHDFSAVCHGNLTRRQFITICTDVFWDTCQVFFCSIATKASGVLLKQLITTDNAMRRSFDLVGAKNAAQKEAQIKSSCVLQYVKQRCLWVRAARISSYSSEVKLKLDYLTSPHYTEPLHMPVSKLWR